MPLPASVALPPVARRTLDRLVARLAERFTGDILEVRLFGSRARGDARPGSDVDVLVVVRDEAPEGTEEGIQAEREAIWRQHDEYAHLAALVLQEKRATPASRGLEELPQAGQGRLDLWRAAETDQGHSLAGLWWAGRDSRRGSCQYLCQGFRAPVGRA